MTGIEFRTDGPHSDDYTTALASAFVQVARTLNYATGPHADEGLTYPSTVYTVLGDLAAGAYGLGQLLDQLGAFLDREHAAGRLGDDRHPDRDPADAMALARELLTTARNAADALSLTLSGAQLGVSGLHTRRPRPTAEGES